MPRSEYEVASADAVEHVPRFKRRGRLLFVQP